MTRVEKATLLNNNKRIKVYGKPGCVACDHTKAFLEDYAVDYTYIDISRDYEALHEMKAHGYRSIPVVAIGSLDNSWADYRPDLLEKLVEVLD